MAPLFALSSASVYPETTTHAFEYADQLGYDAVEVMVSIDVVSQSIDKVLALRDYHQVPVCAMHAPCLLITQRVWGTDPWAKLERSAEMAAALDADVVVVHPPFRWQRDYASRLRGGDRRPRASYGHRLRGREHVSLAGHLAAGDEGLPARLGPLGGVLRQHHHRPLARGDGPVRPDRDGRAARRPAAARAHDRRQRLGQGRAPRARPRPPALWPVPRAARRRAASTGHIVAEINTRKAGNREAREADLLETLAFSRLHFASAGDLTGPSLRLGSLRRMRAQTRLPGDCAAPGAGPPGVWQRRAVPHLGSALAEPDGPSGFRQRRRPHPPRLRTPSRAPRSSRATSPSWSSTDPCPRLDPGGRAARDQATCSTCRELSDYIEELKKDGYGRSPRTSRSGGSGALDRRLTFRVTAHAVYPASASWT